MVKLENKANFTVTKWLKIFAVHFTDLVRA
jgi:hypothetical protein